jgi:hypothetical protein
MALDRSPAWPQVTAANLTLFDPATTTVITPQPVTLIVYPDGWMGSWGPPTPTPLPPQTWEGPPFGTGLNGA